MQEGYAALITKIEACVAALGCYVADSSDMETLCPCKCLKGEQCELQAIADQHGWMLQRIAGLRYVEFLAPDHSDGGEPSQDVRHGRS